MSTCVCVWVGVSECVCFADTYGCSTHIVVYTLSSCVVKGIKKRLKSLPTIILGPVSCPASCSGPWVAFYVHS